MAHHTGRVPIRLERLPLSEKRRLKRLVSDYLTAFHAADGTEPERDADGDIVYRYFDAYWTEPERIPFGIRRGTNLVGFCLLRDTGTHWEIAEFAILPTYRRRGYGAAAVAAIKEFCQAQGTHGCLEASTRRWNTEALQFWRAQGFVTEVETPDTLINRFRWETTPQRHDRSTT